jgi:hypothetical protein
LQARGGVHEVAGNHPLPHGAQGHRRLAGEDSGADLDGPRAHREATDGLDQLEARPHGALGVVLVRGRGPPDGHHGVADELLDRAPVAPDDVGCDLEVASQELADGFRVAVLRERREADEIREQDRDHPSLGGATVRTRTGALSDGDGGGRVRSTQR